LLIDDYPLFLKYPQNEPSQILYAFLALLTF